ncbi:MAG: hypothetical protein COA50_16820 [Flavobacteriaceae bacterium]|nr:MAG: hypothetical protein COA50_16820 [Flavobacteriaceae bacterium]
MKHDFENLRHPKAGEPSTQHIYRDVDGTPVLVVNRYDKPEGEKFFLPFDVERGEWKMSALRPIYNLDKISRANPATPIIFVEGEKCADALSELGYLTTTTIGGSNASKKADLSPLTERNVVLWPDNDKPGLSYVRSVGDSLLSQRNGTLRCIPISPVTIRNVYVGANPVTYGKGWDAADAICEGWNVTDIDRLIALATPYATLPEISRKPEPVNFDAMELWHTSGREAYATLNIGGHFENWPISSTAFRDFLSYHHFRAEGKMLPQSALDDKRRTLIGEALFAGEEHKVFNRIGEQGRNIYLDLGGNDWKAVAIDAAGWQVIDRPPVRFQRSRSMDALPTPIPDTGDVELLRPFLNVANETDFKMLIAWLLGCFHPRGPYPILILTGEQGSAKSTTARVLRSLIDPANPMGRSSPQTEQDLVIAAKHNHVLAFDNLSNIKSAIADALCRISTGGGFGTRKLHTDSEEVLFDATRPCSLNGIPDLASRPDLADRSIIVTLPVICNTARQTEAEFWKAFNKAAPQILAGLLDAVSVAIGGIGSVRLPEAPRMADFAKWVTAAEPALGWTHGAFMESYAANRQSVEDAAIEGNPFAEAILTLITDRGPWNGTATELLQTLRAHNQLMADDPHSLPRQANKLTSELRRVQPLLRSRGLTVTFERQGKTGSRVICIK